MSLTFFLQRELLQCSYYATKGHDKIRNCFQAILRNTSRVHCTLSLILRQTCTVISYKTTNYPQWRVSTEPLILTRLRALTLTTTTTCTPSKRKTGPHFGSASTPAVLWGPFDPAAATWTAALGRTSTGASGEQRNGQWIQLSRCDLRPTPPPQNLGAGHRGWNMGNRWIERRRTQVRTDSMHVFFQGGGHIKEDLQQGHWYREAEGKPSRY